MKKILYLMVFIVLATSALSIVKLNNFCVNGLDCDIRTLTVGNLTVYDQYLNVSVVNYNVTGNITVTGGVYANYYNWTAKDGWNIFNGSILVFNESKLKTVYYNAASYAVIRGTLTGGQLNNTQHSNGNYDDLSMNFSEVTGTPGLDLRFNFTDGITSINNIIIRINAEVQTHDVKIQLWDYDDNDWEDYNPTFTSTEGFAILERGVFDSTAHVQNGIVQLRILHEDPGIITHSYEIDWLAVSKGYGTPTGAEIDPLSLHRDGSVGPTGNFNWGNYNLSNVGVLTVNNSICLNSTCINSWELLNYTNQINALNFSLSDDITSIAFLQVLDDINITKNRKLIEQIQAGYFNKSQSNHSIFVSNLTVIGSNATGYSTASDVLYILGGNGGNTDSDLYGGADIRIAAGMGGYDESFSYGGGPGGEVNISGGQGGTGVFSLGGLGGNMNLRAGDGGSAEYYGGGQGGNLNLSAGDGGGPGTSGGIGYGGNVYIEAGYGADVGGNVTINPGISEFGATGGTNGNVLIATNTGKVGINTKSPLSLLHSAGNIMIGEDNKSTTLDNSSLIEYQFQFAAGPSYGYFAERVTKGAAEPRKSWYGFSATPGTPGTENMNLTASGVLTVNSNIKTTGGYVCGTRFGAPVFTGHAYSDTGDEWATVMTDIETEGLTIVCVDCVNYDNSSSTCSTDTNNWQSCWFKVVC